MASVKVGDRVKVADRETSAEDAKSGLFYGYFRNLTGVIERVYEDNTVCVDVDVEGLPSDVLGRHREMEILARDKWIAGLSQEQRNRLTERDKQFKMNYKVVVAAKDVEIAKGGPGKPTKAASSDKPEAPPAMLEPKAAADPKAPEKSADAKPSGPEGQRSTKSASTPKRLTQEDLAAAEREFLKSRKSTQGSAEKQGGNAG